MTTIESTNDEIWANPHEPDLERDVAVLVAFTLYYMSARRDEVAEQLDRLKLLLDETFDSVMCKDNVRRPLSDALRGEAGLDPPSAVEAVRAVLRHYVYGDKAYTVSDSNYGSGGPPVAVFQTADLAESWAALLNGDAHGSGYEVDEFQLLPDLPAHIQLWTRTQAIYALPPGVIFSPHAEIYQEPTIAGERYTILRDHPDEHPAYAEWRKGRINVVIQSNYSRHTKHDPATIPDGFRPARDAPYAPGVVLKVTGTDIEAVRQAFDEESAKLAERLDRLSAMGFAGDPDHRHYESTDR